MIFHASFLFPFSFFFCYLIPSWKILHSNFWLIFSANERPVEVNLWEEDNIYSRKEANKVLRGFCWLFSKLLVLVWVLKFSIKWGYECLHIRRKQKFFKLLCIFLSLSKLKCCAFLSIKIVIFLLTCMIKPKRKPTLIVGRICTKRSSCATTRVEKKKQ